MRYLIKLIHLKKYIFIYSLCMYNKIKIIIIINLNRHMYMIQQIITTYF